MTTTSITDALNAKLGKVEEFKPTPGMYFNPKNKMILNSKGERLPQVNNYISPKTDEEKEICKYFAGIGILTLVK